MRRRASQGNPERAAKPSPQEAAAPALSLEAAVHPLASSKCPSLGRSAARPIAGTTR